MGWSTPGLPVPHHLLKFAQVHIYCISGAIRPSHPLTPSSPSALKLSWRQGLFQWVSVHIRWPKFWSFSFSISPCSEHSGLISLRLTGLISLLSKGLSGVFSSTTIQVFPTVLGVSWFIIHESNPYLGSLTVFSLDAFLSHPLKGQQS